MLFRGSSLLASGRKLRIRRRFSVRFEFVCSAAVDFHGFPREQEPYVSVEVDLSRLRTLEPNEKENSGISQENKLYNESVFCGKTEAQERFLHRQFFFKKTLAFKKHICIKRLLFN